MTFEQHSPRLGSEVFVAPTATVLGRVELGNGSCVLFSAVLRGDTNVIRVGKQSNVQDAAVLHVDNKHALTIGDQVSIGHGSILHGCTIHHRVLVGMGAIIMNGAEIGEDSLVAAGCLVSENTIIPPRSLVMGVPGKVKRSLTDEEVAAIAKNAEVYVGLSKRLQHCSRLEV